LVLSRRPGLEPIDAPVRISVDPKAPRRSPGKNPGGRPPEFVENLEIALSRLRSGYTSLEDEPTSVLWPQCGIGIEQTVDGVGGVRRRDGVRRGRARAHLGSIPQA
jgi:hypothetical protein